VLPYDDDMSVRTDKRFILDGDWDLNKLQLHHNIWDLSPTWRTIHQIVFDQSRDEDTDEYKEKFKNLSKGEKVARNIKDISDLNVYFEGMHCLIDNIRKNGYIPQVFRNRYAPIVDEIGVVVDRNGELIRFPNSFGAHRFSIAFALDCEEITICIKAVHKEWLIKNTDWKKRKLQKEIKKALEVSLCN
jgi:hypothetical protein